MVCLVQAKFSSWRVFLLASVLASLNLPAAIEDLSGQTIPKSLLDKSAAVNEKGGLNAIDVLMQELPELLQRNREILDEVRKPNGRITAAGLCRVRCRFQSLSQNHSVIKRWMCFVVLFVTRVKTSMRNSFLRSCAKMVIGPLLSHG